MNDSSSLPSDVSSIESEENRGDLGPERLWAPWRMQYVGGDTAESGCIFCNRIAAEDDAASLILYRSPTVFVIMNLFPYNTGHVMIVPNTHVATPMLAEPEVLADMARLLPIVLRVLERILRPAGFNIGMNVGSVAGAGVAGHLHEHVVPRWVGDANFMPILAATMVLPELIPVTYAKIRAELAREVKPTSSASVVVVNTETNKVLLSKGEQALTLPHFDLGDESRPVWQIIAETLTANGVHGQLHGWVRDDRADTTSAISLLFTATEPVLNSEQMIWRPIETALSMLTVSGQELLTTALKRITILPVAAPGKNSQRG